jgi:hypothetical protein
MTAILIGSGAALWACASLIAAFALGAVIRGPRKAPAPGTAVPHWPESAEPPPRSPAPDSCALCGKWPIYVPEIRTWVDVYRRCPAHEQPERRP